MKPHFCEGHQGHPKTTMNNPDISALCFFLLLVQDPYFSAQKNSYWTAARAGAVHPGALLRILPRAAGLVGCRDQAFFGEGLKFNGGSMGIQPEQPTKTIGKDTNLSQFYFSASFFFCVAIPLKDKRLCFMEDGSLNWWAIGIQSIIGIGSAWQCNSSTSRMSMF